MADINDPQEEIKEYDAGFSQNPFIASLMNQQNEDQKNLEQYATQMQAQESNRLQKQQLNLESSGVGRDPRSYLGPTVAPQDILTVGGGVIGGAFGGPLGLAAGIGLGAAAADAAGSDSMLSRSLAAGTGQFIQGAGDTFEYLKAVVTPWDDDVDQQTTIGDFLQRKGSDIMNANTTFIPEEMKSVGWNQLADPRFWATDVAKLLPYSMSFFLPAGAAATATRIMLNSTKAYRAASTFGIADRLYQPKIVKAGKKLAKQKGVLKGEEVVVETLKKTPRIIASAIGGGVGGNFAEGAFVAGETLQQGLADGLTPQEAQAAASQVWRDNTNWIAADIAQFGLVFGGLGRLTAGLRNIPKQASFGQKILPFVQAGATGVTEGVVEQYQEVYQEWVKGRAIADQKGEDFVTFSEFFKSDEMLQTRVSAFALGLAMGSRGGYVDAIAERSYQLQEAETRLGEFIDDNKFQSAQKNRLKYIAYTVIDSNGNAALAKSRVERMVAEGQMQSDLGEDTIAAIEQAEDIYRTTYKDNSLSQAGREQIFLSRVQIEEAKRTISAINEQRQEQIDFHNETIKNKPEVLAEQIEITNREHDIAVQLQEEQIQANEELITNIASLRAGKLRKDGKVKRSSIGLAPKEFRDFTTEGIEQPAPVVQRVVDTVKKGAQAVKEGVQKGVQAVREKGVVKATGDALGLAQEKAQEVIKSEPAQNLRTFLQEQFDQGKNFAKKYLKQNAPKTSEALEKEISAAREIFGERVLSAEEVKTKAKEIIQKIKKVNLVGASGKVLEEFTTFVEKKLQDKTVTETVVDIADSLIDKTKDTAKKVVEKGKELADKSKQKLDEATEKVEARTEKVRTEKAKKKSKRPTKQAVEESVKQETTAEDNTDNQSLYDQSSEFSRETPKRKDTNDKEPARSYLERVDMEEFFIRRYLTRAFEEKFPGKNITFTNRQVIEGFGAPASAVFFASTIIVNPRKAMQTDLIHELSHPYYQSIAGTPIQKRLNALLIKRRVITPGGSITGLIENIQYSYPLLTRYKRGKKFVTGGDILNDLRKQERATIDDALSQLLDTIETSSEAGNTIAYKNAAQSLFTYLSDKGDIKRLQDKSQYGLLEEAFAYSNEEFNKRGGIRNVIDNKTDANNYDSLLKRMYKRIFNLADKDAGKSALDKVLPEVRLMNFDEAMTYVQRNFNILNKDNKFKQNSYSKNTMLKQASFDAISTVGLFRIIEQKVLAKGARGEDAVQEIAKEIYKQNNKTYNTDKQVPPFEVTSVEHDYLLRKIRAQVERLSFTEYQRVVDGLIQSVDARLNQGERSDDSLVFSFNQESEQVAEENDKGNIYDQEETLFGDTTSKLIQAYAIEESKKNDKNPVDVKDLLSELHSLGQQSKKRDVFTFVNSVTNSDNASVARFVAFLKSKLKKDAFVDALLLEMSIDFANKKIETMKEVGFMRGDNKQTTWVPGISFSKDEARWQSTLTKQANKYFRPTIQEDKNTVRAMISAIESGNGIAEALTSLYGDSPYWAFIDKRKLTETGNLYTFDNKRYSSLKQLFQSRQNDFVQGGVLQIKGGFNKLLGDLIVQSRAKNYITQVNDVAENPTLTINKENSLHNKNENYATLAEQNIDAYISLMKGLGFINKDVGRYSNIYALMLADRTGKEHNISMLSGVFSTPENAKQDARRNRKYVKMDSQELMLTDFNDFVYALSRFNKGETVYYDQPIAVFGAAKRRYYVSTPIAQTFKQRQRLLQMALDAGYNDVKYKKSGKRVNPFKIVKKKDGLALVGLKQYAKKFKKELLKDPDQIKLNTLIGEKGQKLKQGDIDNYLLNYSINKFFAQEFFIGKHEESDSEIDYIKRAEGAIKRHTPHDRNTPIEFVAFQDVTDFDGFKATDAQAYVLPGDGEIIRKKFGSMRKVGNQFKHVYDYVETNNSKLIGKRTFAKFKIDEITPEMEQNSPYLKKIANILRARKERIGESRLIPGPEVTGQLHDFIPIATFESALKLYAGGEQYTYDLENTTEDEVVERQDDIYVDGTWAGVNGEGFGLQVELDKERHSFHMPSQLFGHHHTNLEAEEEAMVSRMHELAARAMVGFEQKRSGNVIYSDKSTTEQRQKDTEFLSKLIGEEFFGNLNTSLSKYAPGLHPQLHKMLQQLASSRLVKFGTKAMFGGTIAYQTSPIGRDLKSYIKVSDLVDEVSGQQYKNNLNALIEQGKDFVVSEAIIPASAKKDGIKVGDLVLGTRIPAHGKQSSVVFVVKGFAAEGVDGARSTIAIPSRVSHVMGADLDGDAIYLNYAHIGNVPGTTKISPLGQEARVQTNLLEDYQVAANELLDLNIKLLGDIEVDSRRYKEITTPIDIKEVAEDAIKSVESFYGKKLEMDNQLLPTGDAQFFNDNVPAQNMIGTIASLQRVLNVMAGHKVGFKFGINIKGYEEIDSLIDRFDEGKPEGDAFTVAQLLNIVLDNAKYQYANKLGLTPNTVNIYTFLARNGVSIKDVATIMNHPIVKLYDKHRGDQSIMTTTDTNQAIKNAYKEYFNLVGEAGALSAVKKFSRAGDVNLDISKLKGKNRQTEEALFDLLYKTEKLTDEIFSIGKALSVHKAIPQHGHDAQQLINTITEDNSNSFINPNTIDNFRSDPLVKHAIDLLQKQVDRQKSTSFMYTPEARQIIEYIQDTKKITLDFTRYEHRKLIDDYYLMKVAQAVPAVNYNNRTLKEVYNVLETYSQQPGSNFVKKYLLFSNVEGQSEYFQNNIQISPNEINKFSVEETIQQARNEFTLLPQEIKDALLQYDYIKNGLGFKGKSLTPLFAKDYVRNTFGLLDQLLETELNKQISIEAREIVDMSNELIRKHSNIFKKQKNADLAQKLTNKINAQKTVEPASSAKLKLDKREFYQDHLQELTQTLTFEEYLRFTGFDPLKLDNADKPTLNYLRSKYARYQDSVANVEQKENQLGNLERYSIEKLTKEARELQDKEDELASPRLLYKLHLTIGKKAMKKQADKLRQTKPEFRETDEDITVIRKWFGANDMTSKRPEIQLMLNEMEKEYRKYVREVKKIVNEIDVVDRALIKSKSLKGVFNRRNRQLEIYGNMFNINQDERGRQSGISLKTQSEFNATNPSQQERDFYNKYLEITGKYRDLLGKDGMGEFYIPHVQMGNIEALSARGLLGLYANYLGSTTNIDGVMVKGTGADGKATNMTFGEFKELYLTEGGELTMKSGRRIYELRKLKKQAEQRLKEGVGSDGKTITASDLEMDTLMGNGLFSRFNAGRTTRAKELTSFNLAENLRQYVRSITFIKGTPKVNGEQAFEGMENMSTLVDGVIAVNRNMGNVNSAEYLTKVWRQKFLRNQSQVSPFGPTFDKATRFMVRWTALIHLGFSAAVGVGNILAGKYQELRAKGGKNFIKGEKRFWTSLKGRNDWAAMDILKRHRVVEMSFSDVVGQKDEFSKIESLAFLPMELSERWIQGAAFLGELSEEEYQKALNDKDYMIDEETVMKINATISTMHGEGYTQLDQRLLSMYSLGLAAQQFKRWFITLVYNRFKPEDIDRFGRESIGSYRAGYEFVNRMFTGEVKLSELQEEFRALPEFKQKAIISLLNGLGMTAMLLLVGAMSDDEDLYSKNIQKLSNDAMIFTDTNRFVNYTLPPASISTGRNAMQFMRELSTFERFKRDSKFGDAGDLKARGTLRKILPFQDVTEKLLEK